MQKYSEVYGKHPAPFGDRAIARMMEYNWPGNIRELENMAKRYVIVGDEAPILRELAMPRPIPSSSTAANSGWGARDGRLEADRAPTKSPPAMAIPITAARIDSAADSPSLLEIGRRAAMLAEREAIERALTQTRWNRRQAAKILKISYKALLNRLKAIEEQDAAQNKNLTA